MGKRFKQYLNEMTMMAETEPTLSEHFPHIIDLVSRLGKKLGDFNGLEFFNLNYNDSSFLVTKQGGEWIGYVNYNEITILGTKYYQLLIVYIQPQFRNKAHLSKMIWFLKNQFNKPVIDYGVVSKKGLETYLAMNKSGKFDMRWLNTKNGETDEMTNLEGKTSLSGPTDWRIIIESDSSPINMVKGTGGIMGGRYSFFEDVGP